MAKKHGGRKQWQDFKLIHNYCAKHYQSPIINIHYRLSRPAAIQYNTVCADLSMRPPPTNELLFKSAAAYRLVPLSNLPACLFDRSVSSCALCPLTTSTQIVIMVRLYGARGILFIAKSLCLHIQVCVLYSHNNTEFVSRDLLPQTLLLLLLLLL